MTARTTTSNSSRSSEAEVEGAESPAAADERDAATGLRTELSAEPFQLLPTGVPDLDLPPHACAAEAHGQPESRLDVGTERAHLGRFAPSADPARPVRAHPVLGLPHRQPASEHDLEAVLLRGGRLERDERARVT